MESQLEEAVEGKIHEWDDYVWIDVKSYIGDVEVKRTLKQRSVEQLVDLFPLWRASKCLGQEKRIGTLEVGKDADFLLLLRGRAVKWNGRMVDAVLVDRAKRLATESREYLFSRTGYKPT